MNQKSEHSKMADNYSFLQQQQQQINQKHSLLLESVFVFFHKNVDINRGENKPLAYKK